VAAGETGDAISEKRNEDHRAGAWNAVDGSRYLHSGKEVVYFRSRNTFTFKDYLDEHCQGR
jgi:hypothetical protein